MYADLPASVCVSVCWVAVVLSWCHHKASLVLSKAAQYIQLCSVSLLGCWTVQILPATAGTSTDHCIALPIRQIPAFTSVTVSVDFLSVYMQLPNFLLALPVLCLSFAGCWTYFSQDWTRALLLGIYRAAPRQLGTAAQRWPTKSTVDKRHGLASAEHGFGNDRVAPYVYQLGLMTACACLVMNVQVATR